MSETSSKQTASSVTRLPSAMRIIKARIDPKQNGFDDMQSVGDKSNALPSLRALFTQAIPRGRCRCVHQRLVMTRLTA